MPGSAAARRGSAPAARGAAPAPRRESSRARVSRRLSGVTAAGSASRSAADSVEGASRCSSSSTSPIGLRTGRMAASALRWCTSTSRKARTARRVGSSTVTPASASGSSRSNSTSRPANSASASVSRKGTPGEIVKTRGSLVFSVIAGQAALSAIECSASRIASGVPTCNHSPSIRAPNRRPASSAVSNSSFSEKGSAARPANRRGCRMAAPA